MNLVAALAVNPNVGCIASIKEEIYEQEIKQLGLTNMLVLSFVP